MAAEHSEEEVASLFSKIALVDAFPRVKFHWVNPRASDLSRSILATQTPSVSLNLDERVDAAECLRVISANRNLDMVCIRFTELPEGTTAQNLTHAIATTRSLRKVSLSA
ncbi:uncharacterized protein LOC142772315 [Rhipicephalus microplus]|uniref:uncharacterized protein LOC142772315 n=1 Tax=Rhipicephalus microplus TaxID=6941 RepID=UPI003F6AF7F2